MKKADEPSEFQSLAFLCCRQWLPERCQSARQMHTLQFNKTHGQSQHGSTKKIHFQLVFIQK